MKKRRSAKRFFFAKPTRDVLLWRWQIAPPDPAFHFGEQPLDGELTPEPLLTSFEGVVRGELGDLEVVELLVHVRQQTLLDFPESAGDQPNVDRHLDAALIEIPHDAVPLAATPAEAEDALLLDGLSKIEPEILDVKVKVLPPALVLRRV